MSANAEKANRILDCFVELSSLSRIKRTGFVLAGVTEPETVADHSYETALFAYILSKHVDAEFDLGKVLAIAIFHEVGEARLADLPRRSKKYVRKFKSNAEREAGLDILDGVAEEIIELLDELHECSTPEARLVEAAEELQIIFKAMLYAKENRGDLTEYRIDVKKYDPQGFEIAKQIRDLIESKLNHYLGDKNYWETGYRQRE